MSTFPKQEMDCAQWNMDVRRTSFTIFPNVLHRLPSLGEHRAPLEPHCPPASCRWQKTKINVWNINPNWIWPHVNHLFCYPVNLYFRASKWDRGWGGGFSECRLVARHQMHRHLSSASWPYLLVLPAPGSVSPSHISQCWCLHHQPCFLAWAASSVWAAAKDWQSEEKNQMKIN